MTRLITILLCCLPTLATAAGYYYTKPDATSLPPSGRILMYDPNTGTDKNITGQVLRDQVQPSTDETLTTISQPSDLPLSKQPVDSSQYKRVAEFKDSTGKITSYIQAGGTLVIGTPKMLEVTAVNPANASTGYAGGPIAITFTKSPQATSGSYFYVTGVTATPYPSTDYPAVIMVPAALWPNTAYTLNVVKNSLASLQTDGETTASCGTAMADVSGLCQSTFTTGGLAISSVYPAAGATGITGTSGAALSPAISLTFNFRPSWTGAGDISVTTFRWTSSSTFEETEQIVLAPSTTDNLTFTLPGTYYPSFDATHLTTYTIKIMKAVGLTSCSAGFTDGGSYCQWAFTAATAPEP
jgi:hypothetical protein